MPRAGAGAGGGSRASEKPHHRPRLRPRSPSPPTPSRRASAAAATAPDELNEASALEATVVSSVQETSFTIEFKRGFKRAKKADSPSMDAPRGEGISREGLSYKRNAVAVKTPTGKQEPEKVELTHCAPSIVARLMGLDTMPRPKKALDRCQSDIQDARQRHVSGVGQEVPPASSGDRPCHVGANELPALKDVFEVSEMENMAVREVSRVGNKKQHLRSSEADVEFVRQKFMDVKRLSTDEANRSSKEFSEALEILHSKKDVFLEILQENKTAVSGFSGDILNHSGLQDSSHASAAAAAQSFQQELCRSMEVGNDGVFDAATDSEESISNVLLKETSVTPFEPLEEDGSKRGSGHHSHIVVLKPNLRRKSFTPVVSSQEGSQYDWSKKSPKPVVMHAAPNNEVSEQGDIMRQRTRNQTHKSGSRRRPSEEECKLAVDRIRVKVASTSHDDTIPICSSTGSSVRRKARKHLSERWQTACQFGSENSNPNDIKTLGEILELSDRDATKEASSHKRSSDPKSDHDNSRQVPAIPLGISSKDGWKTGISCEDHSRGGISRNFPRSKSLPASSTSSTKLSCRRQSASTRRLPILKDILNTPTDESEHARVKKRSPIRNAKQKNGRAIVHAGKENTLPEKEIHVTSEMERHSICISDLPQAVNTCTKYPDDIIRSRDQQTSEYAVQHDQQNSKGHTGRSDSELTTTFPETEEDKPVYYQDIIGLKEGRNPSIEIDFVEGDTEAIQSMNIATTESCGCSSPTASSQQSSGEHMPYSGIFNSINVGIQGLREQLKMLKMEDQDGTCGYSSDSFSSDECSNMNTSIYSVIEDQVPLFKDEEDRDFSYVQDMLDSVSDFPAYPEDWHVSSDVFLWLENKYNKLLLWSKSDRKLLFDLVNSVFSDMISQSNSLHSKIMVRCLSVMDRGHFGKYVWQMVQKRRCCEQVDWDCIPHLPLDHRSELELIKMEIFKMIHDDIVEEATVEFTLNEN